jgi:hypothetical protein
MLARLVVAAVFGLAAVAAADAVRRGGSEQAIDVSADRRQAFHPSFHAADAKGFVALADGRLTKRRVVRNGAEVLSAKAVDRAFPVPFEEGGTFDIADLAVAPDGTLAVAVYKFPAAGSVRAGIELWKGDVLVASFEVPPGSFADGIGFSADGDLVVAFEQDGREATLFDRKGHWEGYVPLG